MARQLMRHSVQTAEIIIISREGQGIGYTVPVDLVLVLLWFLSSATAQFLAVLGMAAFVRLRAAWGWWTDWPAWVDGWQVVVEDFRRVGRMVYV